MTFGRHSIWDVIGRALDEAGVVVLAKLVEKVLGVHPDGDAVLIDWVLGGDLGKVLGRHG